MEKQYYLPAADDARDTWALNFNAKLTNYATKYGITAAELDDVKLGAESFSAILKYQMQFASFNEAITAFKNGLRNGLPKGASLNPLVIPGPTLPNPLAIPGIFGRMVAVVNKIKVSPNYSVADGEDLGIEGSAAPKPDPTTLRPTLTAKLGSGGHPELRTPMQGFKAVEYQVDRGDGAGWVDWATSTQARIMDMHPLPAPGKSEVWQYRGIYTDHNQRVGQWSTIVPITVTG